MKYFKYISKSTYKGERIKDNQAERLSKLQNILCQIIEKDDTSKDKIDKFKSNLVKIIKEILDKSQSIK